VLVAVTGYGQASDRERALAAGFDVHLTKPVRGSALKEMIQLAESRISN
jgi:CheY-like chemotaxis protein